MHRPQWRLPLEPLGTFRQVTAPTKAAESANGAIRMATSMSMCAPIPMLPATVGATVRRVLAVQICPCHHCTRQTGAAPLSRLAVFGPVPAS